MIHNNTSYSLGMHCTSGGSNSQSFFFFLVFFASERLIWKNMTGDPEGGWYTLESCEAGCVESSKLPDFRISDRSLSTMHDLPNNVKRGHNIGLQCLWCSSECNRESGSMCRFSKLLKKQTTAFVCFSLWTTSSAHLTCFHPMILLVATDQIMASMQLWKSFTNDFFKNQNFSIFLPHLKNKNQVSTTKECSILFFLVLMLPKFAQKSLVMMIKW